MGKNGNGRNGRYTAAEVAEALTEAKGFTTHAARRLGCTARTVQNYMKRHSTVRQARDEAKESLKDHTEIKLVEAINEGNMTAIIFFLKTQAKDRGYVERQEIKWDSDKPIKIELVNDWRPNHPSAVPASGAASGTE